MGKEAFEDTHSAEYMTLVATHWIDEGFQASKGLMESFPSLSLWVPYPKLLLLVVSEVRKIVVVLRVSLRHVGCRIEEDELGRRGIRCERERELSIQIANPG